MTPPTTTSEFLELLEQSLLLQPEQVAEFVSDLEELNPAARDGLARILVQQGLLTTFQARQLLRGRYKGFFLADKYKILDVIGEGGMGRVLLCEHLLLQRLVAVKILNFHGEPPPPGTAERFLREARAAAALDHPNITRVFDADNSSLGPFLVMEYVDGTNLHQIVSDHGALPVERAANYIYQAALALGQADKMGLVHRDIKPGNLLLDRSGTVKLLDLGLARFHDDHKNAGLTKLFDPLNVLGTADFIAPEQTLNSSEVDIRADIYSLGCSLFFLLTRHFPFEEGSTTQKLLWHQSRPLPLVKERGIEIPDSLNAILLKMTQKQPSQRFQNPAELATALDPWSHCSILPPDHEMPKVQASFYRLGLSPFSMRPLTAESDAITSNDSHSPSTTPPSGRRLKQAKSTTPEPARSSLEKTQEFKQPTSSNFTFDSDSIDATDLNIPIQTGLMNADELHSGFYSSPAPTEEITTPSQFAGSSRLVVILALLLATTLGLCGGYLLWRPGNPNQPTAPSFASQPVNQRVFPIAGSSLLKPLMTLWVEEYERRQGVRFKYQGDGSDKGVNLAVKRSVLMGVTDSPLSKFNRQEIQQDPLRAEFLEIPLVVSGLSVAYNLPSLKDSPTPLQFSGELLAKIYLGSITHWNDPAIRALNPHLSIPLPDLPICVGIRESGSGSTYIWTNYLADITPEWSQTVPSPTTEPKWPEKLRNRCLGTTSQGLAKKLKETIGSIGYLEGNSAEKSKLQIAEVINSAGFATTASSTGLKAAAAMSQEELRNFSEIKLVNRPDDHAYPIVGITWGVFYAKQERVQDQEELAKFLRWILTDGSSFAQDLGYEPLGLGLKTEALRVIQKLDVPK